ncbi:MAG TPA: ATP-grasp domain-containing protein [Thermomicrobiales bacterium]|nr:ATP-grasp domain-containing protein [Thermomicrobiales bacterium]
MLGEAATPAAEVDPRPRVLLLVNPTTYRADAFLAAAGRLGLDVVQAHDLPDELAERWRGALAVDFAQAETAAARIAAWARRPDVRPPAAIVALDDSATLLAARAAARLGLPHNDPAAALAARDKFVMRERLAAAGVPVPAYRRWPLAADPRAVAAASRFPVVVKPLRLSGSRGVIRADDADCFVAAWERTKAMLLADGADPAAGALLVERYLPGVEVALEGLLAGGELRTLAIFDKPDPLEGPFFEETIYVTPSRLPPATQAAISACAAAAAAALGLREGPVHAELRINDEGVWPIELAGRSIGGLCSSVLEFGVGVSLEELILRHAVGLPLPATERSGAAAGVMMIPIPRRGMLRGVSGVEDALAVPGVTGVEITAKLNQPLTPLPEGASYLGFIFARAATPAAAEAALRDAHAQLRFRIDPMISLLQAPA